MNVDEKKNDEVKEDSPAWAKQMQETLQSIADSLRPPQQEETDPNEPTPIPVPELPPQDEPTPEPILDPQPQDEPKPPKRKSLWEWLR